MDAEEGCELEKQEIGCGKLEDLTWWSERMKGNGVGDLRPKDRK